MSGQPAWLAKTRQWAIRNAWLCPAAAIALAAAAFVAFGFSLMAAVLAALFLVCPALIAWGAISEWRHKHSARVRRWIDGGRHAR